MQPADYSTFYVASTSAGAALIGLLFVSISLAPETTVAADAPWERRAAASSAYAALVNAFFVSLGALLPPGNLGISVIVMSVITLLTSIGLAADLLREGGNWRAALRRGPLLALSIGVYSYELWNGLLLLRHGTNAEAQQTVATVVMGIFGLGLVRAWELLGAQRYGLLGRISPLHPQAATPAAECPAESSPAQTNV